jgi:hypothetical protein
VAVEVPQPWCLSLLAPSPQFRTPTHPRTFAVGCRCTLDERGLAGEPSRQCAHTQTRFQVRSGEWPYLEYSCRPLERATHAGEVVVLFLMPAAELDGPVGGPHMRMYFIATGAPSPVPPTQSQFHTVFPRFQFAITAAGLALLAARITPCLTNARGQFELWPFYRLERAHMNVIAFVWSPGVSIGLVCMTWSTIHQDAALAVRIRSDRK